MSFQRFGGSADDWAFVVELDTQGRIYQLGETRSFGSKDTLLLRYAVNGALDWAETWGGPGDQDAEGFVKTANDEFLVSGRVPGALDEDAFLLRYDPTGSVLWAKSWDSGISEALDGIAVYDSGGTHVFAAGELSSPTAANRVLLQSYDLTGAITWSYSWQGASGAESGVNAVAVDVANQRLYAAGHYAGAAGGLDAMLMQLDYSGIVQWVRTWDRGGCDDAYNVAVDGAGNVLITGGTLDVSDCEAPDAKTFVAKFDPTGSLVWDRVFGGALIEGGGLSVVPVSNDVLLSGATILSVWGQPNAEGWIARLSSSGAPQWKQTWGGPGEDAIIVGWIGGAIYATGETSSCSGSFRSCDQSTITDPNATIGSPSGTRAVATGTAANLSTTTTSRANAPCSQLDAVLMRLELTDTGTPYCFGDGFGTVCPCGLAGCQGEGCPNSTGRGGTLRGSGAASLSADTLVLQGWGMTNSSCLYFQGTTTVNGGNGAVFGDGLRCAGGMVARLGIEMNASGASQYPAMGELPVSVRGSVTSAGARSYQTWYRNAATFCVPETFNLTNGLTVTWGP